MNSHPQIVRINRTLADTRVTLLQSMGKLAERGERVEKIEEHAVLLEETSHAFILQIVPWYRKPFELMKRLWNPDYIPFYYCCAPKLDD